MKFKNISALIYFALALCACDSGSGSDEIRNSLNTENELATVTEVTVTGGPGSYTFWVTIESPDTGCDQYADWWEVLTTDGTLVYRRILTHSHVGEQPFTRSGGPVNIAEDQTVFVRAHMNSTGYGEQVYEGSVKQGFVKNELNSMFAEELEGTDPLPTNCAF